MSASEDDALSRRYSDNSQIEGWRVKVDDDISGLSKKMAGFESVLSSVAHSMEALSIKFDKMQNYQASSSKTQWPVIFGALTLVAVIIGGFMGGYVRDLNRVEDSSKEVSKEFVNHIRDGHPGRVAEGVAHNAVSIKELDITLQREMRLLIQTEQDNLASLDTRLQREMVLISAAVAIRDSELERRMSIMENRVFTK